MIKRNIDAELNWYEQRIDELCKERPLIDKIIPKSSKQAYRASLILTLISFALYAVGIRLDDPVCSFLQVVFPAYLPFLIRETFTPMGDDY